MKYAVLKKVIAIVLSIALVIGVAATTAIIVDKTALQTAVIKDGLSAYELAVQYGYEGTVQEWLGSLNGKSAYEIAKENGYSGTETEWSASLKATAGKDGVGIKTAAFSEKNELLITLTDNTVLNLGVAKGSNGKDGVGITAANINADGELVLAFSDGKTVNLDKVVGMNGTDGIGISSSVINADGELVITYTNGQTANLGVVVGAKGDKGDQGEQGIQGATGATGAQGVKGDKGDTGATGQDGVSVTKTEINNKGELVITLSDNTVSNLGVVVGAKGDKGDTGAQGIQGIQGEKGEQGIQGIQGIQGEKGETGAKGKDGEDGTGIESIIIDNGNLKITLTNETTLDLGNIKGEKGDKGDKGDTGATGATGAQGIQGDTGTGISKVEITNDILIITLSDDTIINLGNIKGDKGDKGDTGAAGNDGVGISAVVIDDEGHLKLTFTTGVTTDLGNVKGADGKDGVGIDEIYIQDGNLFVKKTNDTAALNLGSVKGEKGETGAQGPQGLQGAAGRGITRTEINGTNFIIYYTDGTSEIHDLSEIISDQNEREVLVFSKLADGTYGVMAGGMAKYEAVIEIPATYNGVAVTQILAEGFKELKILQSITLPDSITAINDYAFYGCISLNKINLPNSLSEIRTYAFYECTALTEIIIPDSISLIGSYAFYKSGLTSVVIPYEKTWELSPDVKYITVRVNNIDYYSKYTNNKGTDKKYLRIHLGDTYLNVVDFSSESAVANALTSERYKTSSETYYVYFSAAEWRYS